MAKDHKSDGFIVDVRSPYFLHPSNSPGALIIAIKFDGKNYNLSEQAMRTSFGAKNELGFIDGTITKPSVKEGEDLANAWDIANSMITFQYCIR